MFWMAQPRIAKKHDEKNIFYTLQHILFGHQIFSYTYKICYILSKSRCFIITFLKYIDVKLWKIDQVNLTDDNHHLFKK